MENKKIVIYKEYGKMYVTEKANYDKRIMDANKCALLENKFFPTTNDAIEYFVNICNYKKENITVVE